VWREVRDMAPIVAPSMRWCAQCGVKYEMLRQVWRQVQDGVPKYGANNEMLRQVWRQVRDVSPSMAASMTLIALAPILVPLCCAKYGATYTFKCPSCCQVWLHARDNDIERSECWCQVWDQSSNETPIMALPCFAKYGSKCDTVRQVWLQVRDFAPSMARSVRLSAKYGSKCETERQVWLQV
jgi:hypothetical protein